MQALAIRPDTFRFTVMLGLLAALPPVSIDISQPTLLAVQHQFGVPYSLVGLTITVFMVGFALGQFTAGPLSDRHGRRPVLLGSLVCYTAAALGCFAAPSVLALIGFRLMQGVAAGSCAVLAFAIIRDLFEGDAGRAKRSYVTVVFSLAPMLAPTLGAWLLQAWGWRPIYMMLSCTGIVLLVAVSLGVAESRAALPEGVVAHRLHAAYASMLKNKRFIGLAAVNALSFGCIFAYIAGSPQVLMGSMQLTPYGYGGFFACTAMALTLGAFASGRSVKYGIGPKRLLYGSLAMASASAIAIAILLFYKPGSALLLLPLMIVNVFCRGITAPNAQHMALEPIRDQAGTAAATVGVMQILTGAISSAAVAVLLPWLGPSGMAVVMATLATAALVLWLWLCRPVGSGSAGVGSAEAVSAS